jgi:hypothetical protein
MKDRLVTFQVPRPDPVTGNSRISVRVHKPKTPIGSVASAVARRIGFGACEILSSSDPELVIDPTTPTDELHEAEEPIISPELTPAVR